MHHSYNSDLGAEVSPLKRFLQVASQTISRTCIIPTPDLEPSVILKRFLQVASQTIKCYHETSSAIAKHQVQLISVPPMLSCAINDLLRMAFDERIRIYSLKHG
ncbi:hypothetical protein AVEN_167481-1 [Araneus ventricosus]|uniref:Uncharacterized protein n=1 Tax=Araneus ventricosus TaxID=182803 RepID=A0A4Y2QAG1_ARAVE|nr:hypothetical protein AVEN_167481-1 [Araneus ventricosus]